MVDVCLLYVSRSCLPSREAEAEIDRIIEVSLSKNAGLDITGALVFTGAYFAQCLEGPAEHVTSLMASIEQDPRHRDVRVINTSDIESRHFHSWTMAYNGPSLFIEEQITRFFRMDSESSKQEARKLLRLMTEFQKSGRHPSR